MIKKEVKEVSRKVRWRCPASLHLTSRVSSLFPIKPNLHCQHVLFLVGLNLVVSTAMKFNPKKLSPKRIFGSKKDRSEVSRSDPPSFSSGTSSSSDLSTYKAGSKKYNSATATPTSVLPSGDWSDLTTDLQSDLSEALKFLDRDNDGLVSRTHLEALLCRLGAHPPTRDELSLMLSDLDRHGDGSISVDALMTQVVSSAGEPAAEPELRETFEFFDTDHDGKITAEELLAVFIDLGDEQCTLDDCRRMIAVVDKNGDGFVCFDDFTRMMELQQR